MTRAERKYWRFPCGHVGGEVIFITTGEIRIRALLLYERSVETEPGEMPQLRGRVQGTMTGIRCTICGRVRDWVIGEDALEELLARRNERKTNAPFQ